jgi:hypothetical protein
MRKRETFYMVFSAILIASYFFLSQPLLTLENSLIWDAAAYYDMADQISSGEPINAEEPFVYRLGLPFLVGLLQANEIIFAFKALNFLFGIATFIVLLMFLNLFFQDRLVIILLSLVFLTAYNSPVRFPALYPVYTDPPVMFFGLMILYLSHIWTRLNPCRTAILCILGLAVVMCREIGLLASLAAVFAHRVQLFQNDRLIYVASRAQFTMSLLPIFIAVIWIVASRYLVIPSEITGAPSYGFIPAAFASAKANLSNPLNYFLGLFFAYGPLILTLAFSTLTTIKKTAENQMLLVYGVGVAFLALVGGTHTQRFFFWGFPFFLIAMGIVMQRLRGQEGKIWANTILLSLLVLQLVAQRVLLTIPDISNLAPLSVPDLVFLAPFGEQSHYFHIWARRMSWELQLVYSYQYCRRRYQCLQGLRGTSPRRILCLPGALSRAARP